MTLASPSWTIEEAAELAGGRILRVAGSDADPTGSTAARDSATRGSALGDAAARHDEPSDSALDDAAKCDSGRIGYREISLDSRTLRMGDFFVALRGEVHDGHDHLDTVYRSGALGALVERPLPVRESEAGSRAWTQIVVDDSLGAWQRWGSEHCLQWKRLGEKQTLAITGSSGKTTVKDLASHLLGGVSSVWATEGNRNNHVGVPWTLLGLAPQHGIAVIEMGMNHPGEIALLSRLTRPDVALITSIGRAHVGYLGSREAILAAKLEILEGLPDDGVLVLPSDPWVLERVAHLVQGRRVRTFGSEPTADWRPEGAIELSLNGARFATRATGPIELPLLGPGAVLSALAALAAVDALGEDVRALAPRLATAPRHRMRMEPRTIDGVHWILDCYNASPESSRYAIDFVQSVPHPGRRILVLGALGELGSESESIHRELGAAVRAVDIALFVGADARPAYETCRMNSGVGRTKWSATREEASTWLAGELRPGDLVLLKGSRRLALERILERLTPDATPPAEA